MGDYQHSHRRPAPATTLSRKHAYVGGGVSAAAGKSACYDDVFGGTPRYSGSLAPARPEDYAEIFGGARSSCSIPVLDLPPEDDGGGFGGYDFLRGDALDYLDIFGGFDGGDFAVSYEELFANHHQQKQPQQHNKGVGGVPEEAGDSNSQHHPSSSSSSSSSSTTTSYSSSKRDPKETVSEKQAMKISRLSSEGPKGNPVSLSDKDHLSSNGDVRHLNDGMKQFNMSHNIAGHKEDAINGTIHKNHLRAVPGFSFIVDAPLQDSIIDNPPIQVRKVLSDADCNEETSGQKHSRSFTKGSGSDLKADQKESNVKFTAEDPPESEQYHSCSDKQSKSDGVSAKSATENSLHADFIGVVTEGKPTHPFSTKSSGNDLQVDMKHTAVKCTAVEDVPENVQRNSCSSSDHSTSNGSRSFLDRLASDVSFDADFNLGMAEAKSFRKPMPTFPSCNSLRNSENDLKDQKPFTTSSSALRNAPVKEYQHSCSSVNHSMPNCDRSYPEGIFLRVSDINLRTQPSQVPPPSRPPPKLVLRQEDKKTGGTALKSDLCERKVCADYRTHDTGNDLRSNIRKLTRDSSHFFDVEVDASSAAAADAAMKEAMEQAEARLRSAKVSMERKKDILLNRKKLGSDGVKYKERKEDKTIQEDQRIKDELVQVACEKMDTKGNGFAAEGMEKTFGTVSLDPNLNEKGRHFESIGETPQTTEGAEFRSTNVLYNQEERTGEWKVVEQFFEVVKNEKFKKVQESFEHEGNKNNLKAVTTVKEEEINLSEAAKLGPELKKDEKSMAASKFEFNSNKLKEANLATQEEEIKETSKAIPEAYLQEEDDIKLKVSLNTCQQDKNEKKPREVQEVQGAEQESKWTASEGSFIFEVGERKLKTDIGVHKCEMIHKIEGEQKKLKASWEDHKCVEGDEKMNGTNKNCGDEEGERNLKVADMIFELDEINKEREVAHMFEEGVFLEGNHKTHEDEELKKTVGAVTDTCHHDKNRMKLKDTAVALEKDKNKKSNVALQACEWAENEDKPKVDQGTHDCNENEKKLSDVQVARGYTASEKKMEPEKESKKLSGETQELQRNERKQNIAEVTCELKDIENKQMATEGDHEQRENENVQEFTHDSKDRVQSTQEICHNIENVKETKDTQHAVLTQEQGYRPKTAQVSIQGQDTEWAAKSNHEVHKTEEKVNEERIEMEREQEREQVRKLEEKERERRLDEEKERERRRVEEEKERERKMLEEERMRERKMLEEERMREREREREREKKIFAEEREKEREKKRPEEERENERIRLDEKERERKLGEEKKREMRRLTEVKENERRRLEEEKEGERRRLEEEKEKERGRLEEEKERERGRLEEEKERERRLEEEKERERRRLEEEKERERKLEEEREREREREREKDRQAVERATLEVRERAFADARERAERAAVERVTAEARQRALAEAREKAEKASAEALEKSLAEKASREARLRAERAAVERATAEARERAVEKALAEKAALEARERTERFTNASRDRQRKDNEMDGNISVNCKEDSGMKRSTSSSDMRDSDHQFQNTGFTKNDFQRYPDSSNNGCEGESPIRCKARLERHQRTVVRAAKALAEKNLRDLLAQKEQAERNRLAETLDADVRRWSNGKEGNLRALLSTLQYILGPESGWHPVSLTDVLTATAVKKAYRKATLCVHPDKLQQRGASIQQKYVCEKVFDLLKEAWNRFNSEER